MSASEFVTLINGPTVPLEVFHFILALEHRGVRLIVKDGELYAGPAIHLTSADRDAIRRWREPLKALATYEGEPVK